MRAHYSPVITDLDRPELGRPVSRWPLPVVTGLCVAAFIGLSVGVSGDTRPTAGPASASLQAAPTGAPETRALAGPPAAAPPEPRLDPAPLRPLVVQGASGLGLPATAYKSVARVPNSVTTGLYPADEEALLQLRYRLPDDRVVVLVRVPISDPLRGVNPASYVADSVIVRGIEARMLSGRSAMEPTILLWTEGPRSYQLYSSTLSGPELIQVAELLR
jgi:hypothetical protein